MKLTAKEQQLIEELDRLASWGSGIRRTYLSRPQMDGMSGILEKHTAAQEVGGGVPALQARPLSYRGIRLVAAPE